MSLLVELQSVPEKILAVVKARILANRKRLDNKQEAAKVRAPTRPRVQRSRFNASSTSYRRPEPSASPSGGLDFGVFYEDGKRIYAIDGKTYLEKAANNYGNIFEASSLSLPDLQYPQHGDHYGHISVDEDAEPDPEVARYYDGALSDPASAEIDVTPFGADWYSTPHSSVHLEVNHILLPAGGREFVCVEFAQYAHALQLWYQQWDLQPVAQCCSIDTWNGQQWLKAVPPDLTSSVEDYVRFSGSRMYIESAMDWVGFVYSKGLRQIYNQTETGSVLRCYYIGENALREISTPATVKSVVQSYLMQPISFQTNTESQTWLWGSRVGWTHSRNPLYPSQSDDYYVYQNIECGGGSAVLSNDLKYIYNPNTGACAKKQFQTEGARFPAVLGLYQHWGALNAQVFTPAIFSVFQDPSGVLGLVNSEFEAFDARHDMDAVPLKLSRKQRPRKHFYARPNDVVTSRKYYEWVGDLPAQWSDVKEPGKSTTAVYQLRRTKRPYPPPPKDSFGRALEGVLVWDGNEPAYCREQLLALGFSPQDLSVTAPSSGSGGGG